MDSGYVRSSGWFGTKKNFYYNVPSKAVHVFMDCKDLSGDAMNWGVGNGDATLSWQKGSTTAKVFAWVNGKVYGKNEISWTLWADILE